MSQQSSMFEQGHPLRKVGKYGRQTKSGKVIYDLTDKEAAVMLGWERTSVNGRRNELCGGSGSPDWVKKQPLVVSSQKRKCLVSGNTCTAWRTAAGLFDLTQNEAA